MTNKLKKILAAGAIVLGINAVQAHEMQIVATPQKAVFEATLAGNLTDRISLFNKNQITANYKKGTGFYSFLDLGYNIGKGFSATFEMTASPTGITPRIGPAYFAMPKGIAIYARPTIALNKKLDISSYISLGYQGKLKNDYGFVIGAENLSLFGNKGLNFMQTKARAGITKRDYTLGAYGEMNIIPHLKPMFDTGVYVSKKF